MFWNFFSLIFQFVWNSFSFACFANMLFCFLIFFNKTSFLLIFFLGTEELTVWKLLKYQKRRQEKDLNQLKNQKWLNHLTLLQLKNLKEWKPLKDRKQQNQKELKQLHHSRPQYANVPKASPCQPLYLHLKTACTSEASYWRKSCVLHLPSCFVAKHPVLFRKFCGNFHLIFQRKNCMRWKDSHLCQQNQPFVREWSFSWILCPFCNLFLCAFINPLFLWKCWMWMLEQICGYFDVIWLSLWGYLVTWLSFWWYSRSNKTVLGQIFIKTTLLYYIVLIQQWLP